MGGTMGTYSFVYTTKDSDQLPKGVWDEDVGRMIHRVVGEAMRVWYRDEGHKYLAIEPTCVDD